MKESMGAFGVFGNRHEKSARKKKEPEEQERMTRRAFLGGGAALGAGFLVGGKVGNLLGEHAEESTKEKSMTQYDKQGISDLIERSEPATQEQASTNEQLPASRYFIARISQYVDAYEQDIPYVLEYGNKVTMHDAQQRTRIEYVKQALYVDGVSETIDQELRAHIAGLCFEESRFNADRVSSTGARGLMQIMPATWEQYGGTDDNALSLVEQTRIAGKLFADTYRYLSSQCTESLQKIRAVHFGDDTEAFEKYFVVPTLINAHNAGMGTMRDVVNWFAENYSTPEHVAQVFNVTGVPSGYDIFYAMAKEGQIKNAATYYKQQAGEYTCKIYGASLCLKMHEHDDIRTS